MRVAAICAALALAACATGTGGHYAGPVTPAGRSGPPAPGMLCQGVTRGGLDIAGHTFDFTPNEGTIVLHGTITAAGTLTADTTIAGADHRAYQIRFTATLAGRRIAGQLVTPECQASVALTRQ